ncbi:UNVERIFIED_CONTAM: hypothetical protein Slati_1413700 [Sesamum latifolium]|uniref:Uncharacterized protein n=1 Tax=Sesamum latifolium TaxID=2727402 RepID=A0AAW2X3X4_9LAMI
MARTMLKSKAMLKEFWAETVAYAVYLSNRSPTRSLKKITPQKAWSGWKPSLKHLRILGSICYVYVPEQQRTKLDDEKEEEYEEQEVKGDNSTPSTPSPSDQPQMYHSISDIYDATKNINGDNLFYLFMNDELPSFEDAIK